MNRLEKLQQWFNRRINEGRLKSPWIVHFDCGSCNGCDIETLACLTPVYDVERFGIINVGNPKHADVLLVTGTVNSRNRHVLKNIYDQMPEPKAVIAIGACGMTGGVFRECYNVVGGVDRVIPVDVYVPGCPAKPEAIIDGVVAALEKIKIKLGLIEDPALSPDAGVCSAISGEAAASLPETAPSACPASATGPQSPASEVRTASAASEQALPDNAACATQAACESVSTHVEEPVADAPAASAEPAPETSAASATDVPSATEKEKNATPATEDAQDGNNKTV